MSFGFAIAVVAVLVLGVAGAYLGHRLPIPAGVLLGTLVGVGAVSVGGLLLGLLQVMLGMMVGLRMSRESLRSGMHALAPASLIAAIVISTAFVCALIATPLTSISLVTAIFAAAPGGLVEMSLMGMSFGADGAGVATVQLIRLLVALAAIDVLQYFFRSRNKSEADPDEQEEDQDKEQDDAPAKKTEYKEDLKNFGVAAPWGILGGVIGLISQVP